MIVLYLLFSQLTLSLVELPAGALNKRGKYLYEHLKKALGMQAHAAFYAAAPIKGLMMPFNRKNKLLKPFVTLWPAYISETLFAQIIVGWVSELATAASPANASLPAIQQFAAGLPLLQDSDFRSLLQTLYATATATATTSEAQSKALQKNLEDWFHEYGSRMSGWYKRDNRKWLFLAGLLVAVLADVDTVRLTRFISDSNNEKARAILVAAGVQATKGATPSGIIFNPADTTETSRRYKRIGQLDSLLMGMYSNLHTTLANVPKAGLPLGWLRFTNTDTMRIDTTTVVNPATGRRSFAKPATYTWAPTADDYLMPVYAQRWTLNKTTGAVGHPLKWSWLPVIGSWLLTAFAMMLGAPFWFDTLSRFVNIRNVGTKPPRAGR